MDIPVEISGIVTFGGQDGIPALDARRAMGAPDGLSAHESFRVKGTVSESVARAFREAEQNASRVNPINHATWFTDYCKTTGQSSPLREFEVAYSGFVSCRFPWGTDLEGVFSWDEAGHIRGVQDLERLVRVLTDRVQAFTDLADRAHKWHSERVLQRIKELAHEDLQEFIREYCYMEDRMVCLPENPEHKCRISVPVARAKVKCVLHPEVASALEEFMAGIAPRIEEEAQKEIAKVESQLRKYHQQDEQMRRWVEEKGTENQKGRYELGLLPEEEILKGMREEAFAPLADVPRARRLSVGDVPCECGCGYVDAEFESEPARKASAEEFDAFVALRDRILQALPEATVTLMERKGQCHSCGRGVRRLYVRTEVPVGAFRFSREFALDVPDFRF